MFTSSSTETFDIARSRLRERTRKESMRSTASKGKDKQREREEIPMDLLSSYPHSDHTPLSTLPSVVVAETFSTPLLASGARSWAYAGRLAIRLFQDEEMFRPRIFARQLGRRGRTVFDALLTHPVVYSDQPVGCSLWLEEPDEEVRGWCFRFDDPLTARQFATLAAQLSQHDVAIRKTVRRIEAGEWAYGHEEDGEEGGGEGSTSRSRAGGSRGGSWVSQRLSWLSARS